MTTSPMHMVTYYADAVLNWLDARLTNDNAQADITTASFYAYKPYPSSVKAAQLDDWVALQVRALVPFSHGDRYFFKGKTGLAVWAAPTRFDGIPETALQAVMEDGEHWVKGEKQCYRQLWRSGEMRECEVLPTSFKGYAKPLVFTSGRHWAKPRRIDMLLQNPASWVALFLWLAVALTFCWGGALFGIATQKQATLVQTQTIERTLGDKLALQQKMQDSRAMLLSADDWIWQYGTLPQMLAEVIAPVLSQVPWQANSMTWQDGVLNVHVYAANLDLARLVTELENTQQFSKVSIRPHLAQDTWILEVEQRVPE